VVTLAWVDDSSAALGRVGKFRKEGFIPFQRLHVSIRARICRRFSESRLA